ncbi:hypothetical protein DP163_gp131 [Sea otter poxvirus]|uniref:Uncharacterized protein n=1 Tax=Sea otter poxvirus TaxID=1416741 RepID=A0A2U9QHJ7_9POXV|nr:hypothetical protein DP163_gp002 [Sea otter poxvirus]YP_009480669.1 hypothetical protein DP163_gp131 [Sea otter poxvirus]AWU47047.1 hypothetical protein [Sea otter poxvirus]AWU47176.1 hypothetical protein [Sea otter poxvirus]
MEYDFPTKHMSPDDINTLLDDVKEITDSIANNTSRNELLHRMYDIKKTTRRTDNNQSTHLSTLDIQSKIEQTACASNNISVMPSIQAVITQDSISANTPIPIPAPRRQHASKRTQQTLLSPWEPITRVRRIRDRNDIVVMGTPVHYLETSPTCNNIDVQGAHDAYERGVPKLLCEKEGRIHANNISFVPCKFLLRCSFDANEYNSVKSVRRVAAQCGLSDVSVEYEECGGNSNSLFGQGRVHVEVRATGTSWVLPFLQTLEVTLSDDAVDDRAPGQFKMVYTCD